MKAIRFIVVIFSIMALYAMSCKKPKNNITGGGKGGDLTLQVTPEHHGQFVDSCTVYIKYGTNQAPANSLYDDSLKCVLSDTTPIAAFSGLKEGQYYIFGDGYHAPYNPPYVRGGLPVTLTASETVYLPTYSYDK